MVFMFIMFFAFFGLGIYLSYFLERRLKLSHPTLKKQFGKKRDDSHQKQSLLIYLDESFYVSNDVDIALKEFFDIVINRFVVKWYSDLSCNMEFVIELKHNIRLALNDLLHRLARVNIGHLVVSDIIPLAANHWEACCEILHLGNVGVASLSLDYLLLSRLGSAKHLHCALYSRDVEHSYLFALTNSITSILVRKVASLTVNWTPLFGEILTSGVLLPALDVLSNPDFLNKLLILAIDGNEVALPNKEAFLKGPFLSAYQEERYKLYCSRTDLKNIHMVRKDSHNLLFYFIQYLKSIQRVEVLQFFLDLGRTRVGMGSGVRTVIFVLIGSVTLLEEINSRLLQAEIPPNTLCDIHEDLRSLYRCLQPGGLFHSKMHLSKAFKDALEVVGLSRSSKRILQLQTCAAWFETHGEICRELEHVYLPLFYQSEDYMRLQVGERHRVRQNDNSYWHRRAILREAVLCSNEVYFRDGSYPVISINSNADLEENGDDEVVFSSHEAAAADDEFEEHEDQEPVDLSSWRIHIPRLCQVPCFSHGRPSGRYTFAYQIEVCSDRHVIEKEAHWTALRRIDEFYALDLRLREFHNATLLSNLNLSLPVRGIFKNRERDVSFLKDYRSRFEKYLVDLLAQPFLHHSQLIWSFLMLKEEMRTSPNLPGGLSRLASKVRLLKERSSYLRPFLHSLQTSCLNTTLAADDVGSVDMAHSFVSMCQKQLHLDMYWNNVASTTATSFTRPIGTSKNNCHSHGPQIRCVYDLLLHLMLGSNLQSAPPLLPLRHPWLVWILRNLLIGLKPFLHWRVDNWLIAFINAKVEALLHQHHLVPIIHLLRDTIFFDKSEPRGKREKFERRQESLEALLRLFSCSSMLANKEAVRFNVTLFHDLFQLPKVNKQLSYALLDVVLLQLFPEVEQNS